VTRLALVCALILAFGTGISACGDGVLQTTEVQEALRDAGYPTPRISTYESFASHFGGLGSLLRLFDTDVATDVVSVAPTGGAADAFVVAQVYVDVDSGAGVLLDDSRPTSSTAPGEEIEALRSSLLPQGFRLRQVRTASLCNVRVTAFEASPGDERFERAVGYLTARC